MTLTKTYLMFVGKDEDEGLWAGHSEPDEELKFIPFCPPTYPEAEMVSRSRDFYQQMNERRSVRFFSDKPVPLEVMENIVKTAGLKFVPVKLMNKI